MLRSFYVIVILRIRFFIYVEGKDKKKKKREEMGKKETSAFIADTVIYIIHIVTYIAYVNVVNREYSREMESFRSWINVGRRPY